MRYRPIFQVTEYRNVQRRSPSSAYTDAENRLDSWKVGMLHGYFAGMGMDFYFPTEAQASRFSLWTIYNPGEIIELMDGAKFTVSRIQKTHRMSPPNRYSGQRALVDAWQVIFEGEDGETIEQWHPTAQGTVFRRTRVLTMADILGTLPSMPRDVRVRLEEIAARVVDAQRAAAEATGGLDSGAQAAAAQAAAALAVSLIEASQQEFSAIRPVPRELTLGDRLNNAIAGWYTVTGGGAAGWYANADPSNNTGQPYYLERGGKGAFYYYESGTFLTEGNDLAGFDPITGEAFIYYVEG